jgi:membrane protease YdiL (CAAX protease family)
MVLVGGGLGGARQAPSLGRGRADAAALLLGLACLGAGPTIGLAWPLMSGAAGLGAALAEVGLVPANLLAFAIYYATVNPLLEEWYWRGVLGSAPLAPTASDVAFGGYHVVVLVAFVPWPWALGMGVVLMGAGWLWRQLATRHGGLLVPVVTHALADVSVIVSAALLARTVGS